MKIWIIIYEFENNFELNTNYPFPEIFYIDERNQTIIRKSIYLRAILRTIVNRKGWDMFDWPINGMLESFAHRQDNSDN